MKRRLAALAAMAVLATVGILVPAGPASATAGLDVCAGIGNVVLGLGLGYPVITGGANLTLFAFGYNAGVCANAVNTPTATGTVHGWCGHATGRGVTNGGAAFAFISAGSTVVIYGHLIGIADLTPDPTTGSCLNKAANNFLVTGAVASQGRLLGLEGLLGCPGPTCSH